jgi:hypothetical protein
MNDYFDDFERAMGAAVERGAHMPWYSRAWRVRHGRVFAAVFGALVIGAPAGAVSNCFGACASPHPAQVTVAADPAHRLPTAAEPSSVRGTSLSQTRRRLSGPGRAATPGATSESTSESTQLARTTYVRFPGT